jgi:hypothetical protein
LKGKEIFGVRFICELSSGGWAGRKEFLVWKNRNYQLHLNDKLDSHAGKKYFMPFLNAGNWMNIG